MATSFPPRVGTVFADRYQLRELLGSGGVGQVFRAWDLQSQRLVGLKVYNPAAVSPSTWAAYAELVANAARLRHPDLVLPQGLPPTLAPAPLAVMESLVGEDLATLRARLGRVPWPRAVEIAARVAEILHAVISATGVAHRDLKATNVFLTEAGAIKLLDYGVAEFDAQSADRTRVDSALGIVDYKAPEQLENNIGGFHADVFSLAVLVFEMICGERPFAGASYFVVARKILLEPAPSLSALVPDVPPALDRLLQRALAKRPVDRHADLQALQRAFTELLRGAPRAATSGRPVVQPTPERRPARAAVADDEQRTVEAQRGPRRPGSRAPTSQVKTTPTGSLKKTVPTGARAVVKASEEGLSEVDRISQTVVAKAPTAPPTRGPAPDRTVVYAPTHPAPQRAAPVLARGGPSPEEVDDETLRTQVHTDQDDPPPRGGGERTLILDDAAAAPPRGESTLMLPDDAAPAPERTMLLPDEGEPRGGGTLQLPEGTLQLPGQAAAARGWTLPRVLIAINVACGLLILVGLLVLVFGGDPAPLAPEK